MKGSKWVHGLMEGQMNTWIDAWMGMDAWMDEWMDGRVYLHTYAGEGRPFLLFVQSLSIVLRNKP